MWPVCLEASADVDEAVAAVVEGKSFDYGTVCSSEQTMVAEAASRDRVLAALKANKAYLCDARQSLALQELLIGPNFRINPDCVGKAPAKIAEMAGFSVPAESSILVVELEGVGRDHPMSAEKLSPVLAVYFVRDFQESLGACETILNFGGRGHTCVIHSKNDGRIREFGLRMPAFRVLVNTSAPQGSTGITTNVLPAMTLGCGAIAGNITSDNVGPLHLINIKRIAYHVRDAESAFESPEAQAYFAGPADTGGGSGGAFCRGHAVFRHGNRAVGGLVTLSDATWRNVVFRLRAGRQREVHAVAQAVIANPAASVVDQFLSKRRAGAHQTTSPSAAPGSTGSSGNPSSAASSGESSPAPPAPPVVVVPFVSEDDVRQAILKQQKIYIDASTIVTPAARDLGDARDILVRTD